MLIPVETIIRFSVNTSVSKIHYHFDLPLIPEGTPLIPEGIFTPLPPSRDPGAGYRRPAKHRRTHCPRL